MSSATKETARRRLIRHLLEERPHSAADLTIRTGYSDPRGYIRDLRTLGYNIADKWVKGTDGVRYKLYFIAPTKNKVANCQ